MTLNFATTARVRLTPKQRALQSDLADLIGMVLRVDRDVVEVLWPNFRAWHKASDLEAAT